MCQLGYIAYGVHLCNNTFYVPRTPENGPTHHPVLGTGMDREIRQSVRFEFVRPWYLENHPVLPSTASDADRKVSIDPETNQQRVLYVPFLDIPCPFPVTRVLKLSGCAHTLTESPELPFCASLLLCL